MGGGMDPLEVTLGIEEEYQLCDPATGDLVPRVDELLAAAAPGLRERLGYELLHSVLEANIEVASGVDDAIERLRVVRCEILDLAESRGVAIGIGGVHPFARWQDQDFVDTEGYRWVGHQLQYLARRNLSFGMHVHAHVPDREARVYVTNQMRRWAAPLLALSANAPFFEGADTGFQTIRMHVFGSFPRTGFPPELAGWEHYAHVVDALVASGAITRPRQVWWNVRPHMDYPTVELRMIDMQIDLARTKTFVALGQALAAGLVDDHARGVPRWALEPAFLADGWFKAQRFGWDAPIAHPVTGATVTLADEIDALREAARPWAERLGTTAAADGVDAILAEGPESDWQRAAWEAEGRDLGALQRRIFARVRESVRCPEPAGAPE